LLLGGSLYLLYARIILTFLTGIADKRVVAAPDFSPYEAGSVPGVVKDELSGRLTPTPAVSRKTGGTPAAPVRLPNLRIFEPYDIHSPLNGPKPPSSDGRRFSV
jgi:hypothetical protein